MLEIAITNPGNIWTPCIVEITPRAAGASAFTVKGINRNPDTGESLPVTIRNTTKDKTVILDGETGKITEAGVNKSADVDIWSLPVLMPGTNRITLDNTWMDITVKYRPRFM